MLSKWLGESERALATLFRRARLASPCIVFFDEIDAIAAKRGSGEGGAGGERLLSQLLTELDGVGTSSTTTRVIVVGATNRPDLLDNALVRPGRIDRMIYVGLPDEESRKRILDIGLKGKACADDIDVSKLQQNNERTKERGVGGGEPMFVCLLVFGGACLVASFSHHDRSINQPILHIVLFTDIPACQRQHHWWLFWC